MQDVGIHDASPRRSAVPASDVTEHASKQDLEREAGKTLFVLQARLQSVIHFANWGDHDR